ncbi:hypothetical protein WDV06_16790 [Streptomyces racemochromogenes]|uniref:Uncharacterized protein n=1 Tax=Streptomyces racemochromogenes TaxID=67353 RepID=A0ABW7PED7_9ACTN
MSANVITIEIRGLEPAALKAAERISALFPTSGGGLPRRAGGEDEVLVTIRADLGPTPPDGGYTDTCA